jgi:hypothetical protein
MSSYSKKQVQHKKLDYIEDRLVIKPTCVDLPLVEEIYIYEGRITPTRMIKGKNAYEIIKFMNCGF